MNELFELLEAERPMIPDSNADYDIGYNNGLVMAQAIVLEHDAVPVVRCKDCARGDLYSNRPCYIFCMEHHRLVEKNDYCSYGERKDNGR